MSEPEEKSIHVSMSGESWDVETESSTLASASSKEEAIEAAKEAAPDEGAKNILIHTSEGLIDKKISIPPPKEC
jgi:hypothetical protein